MRRMDRYKDETSTIEKRSVKNQELYQDLANNAKYTNITDVTNSNAFELNAQNREEKSTREAYQQMRKYGGVEDVPKVKKELDDFNYLYPKKEKKIYDINSVLEEARKNRQEKDSLEEKRKLKYTSYNILAGVNLEELAKYREEKKKRAATPEEEGIHELMDTIASKTLAGEISKETTVELLSDLMATSMLDKVVPADEIGGDEKQPTEILETHTISIEETKEEKEPEQKEEVKEKDEDVDEDEDDEKEERTLSESFTMEKINPDEASKEIKLLQQQGEITEKNGVVDRDFYTKSMDLSDQDLEMSEEFAEKGLPLPVKIIIALLIIAVIAVAGYFIYLRIK